MIFSLHYKLSESLNLLNLINVNRITFQLFQPYNSKSIPFILDK